MEHSDLLSKELLAFCNAMHKDHGQTQDTCSDCQNTSQLMALRTLYETVRHQCYTQFVSIFLTHDIFCVSHVDSLPCGCISYNPRLVDSNSAAGTSVPSNTHPLIFNDPFYTLYRQMASSQVSTHPLFSTIRFIRYIDRWLHPK